MRSISKGNTIQVTVSQGLAYGLFALMVYAAWARGGVYPPWQYPLLGGAGLLFVGILFGASEPPGASRILRDPVFYLGAGFLTLLIIQAVNSGYYLYQKPDGSYGMYDRLPSMWMPWSVDPSEAMQMIHWFAPAFTAMLLVRHVLSRSDLRLLLRLMVWNATLLAVVGLVQQGTGAEKMLGLWTIPGGLFFSTFGYVNHAGAFFYLHAAVAAGLAHHAIKHRLPLVQTIVWMVCLVLCLAGAVGSLSRAAGLAVVIMVVCACAVYLRWSWSRSRGNQVVNSIGLAGIIALSGAALYFGAGQGELAEEIQQTIWGRNMEEVVQDRSMQYPGAWEVSTDYPIFGCGGWGYRWMVLPYIPADEMAQWRGAGKANVHCDSLQFLCEFGWTGSLLLFSAAGWLVFDAARHLKGRARRDGGSVLPARGLWIGLGLLLVFLHSWVDLPFRCPAILISWCMLLAALPKLFSTSGAWEECTPG